MAIQPGHGCIFAWGWNEFGQLGHTKENCSHNHALPKPVAELRDVRFVACGDLSGYDADTSYPLDADRAASGAAAGATLPEYLVREPTQKPTTPPYRAYLEAQRSGRKLVLDASIGAKLVAASQVPTVGGSLVGGKCYSETMPDSSTFSTRSAAAGCHRTSVARTRSTPAATASE